MTNEERWRMTAFEKEGFVAHPIPGEVCIIGTRQTLLGKRQIHEHHPRGWALNGGGWDVKDSFMNAVNCQAPDLPVITGHSSRP